MSEPSSPAPALVDDWTVSDLLAHLTATDSRFAIGLGSGVDTDASQPEAESLDARTDRLIAEARCRPPVEAWRAWRAGAAALCRRLADGGPALAARLVDVGGLRLTAGAHAAPRAFETWIHTRDIAVRLAIGLPRPSAAHLHAMAELAVELVRRSLARPGRAVRLTLYGIGGGEWLVPLDRSDKAPVDADTELALDVLDFCLLAAARLDPADADRQVYGDEQLAADVLAAVSSFAGRCRRPAGLGRRCYRSVTA